MRNKLIASAMFLLLAFTCAQAAQITGDYVETRSADIYTGPCFANSEVGLVGDQAILAWHVKDGAWQGESLNGLAVVAAVKANNTLGDPFGKRLRFRRAMRNEDSHVRAPAGYRPWSAGLDRGWR